MKHFKDEKGVVYAFESDGSQDDFISEGLVAITEAEADEMRAPRPPFESEEAAMMTTVRSTREVIINRLMGIAARAQRSGDIALASACDVATEELLGITKSAETRAAAATKSAAQLKQAFMLQYRSIAAALPAAGQSAFKELDL